MKNLVPLRNKIITHRRNRFLTAFFIASAAGSLILAGLYFFMQRPAPVSDIASEAVSFETFLGGALADAGISAHLIKTSFRTVEKEGRLVGVTFSKEIQSGPSEMEKFFEAAGAAAAKRGYETYITRYPEGGDFKVSFQGVVISHITFIYKDLRRVAIIVDDAGNRGSLENFTSIGAQLTYAIIPGLKYSRSLAGELQEAGIPYMLHMPMEPMGYPEINPGNIALKRGMSREKISEMLSEALSWVPGAEGLNNHMGSAFTSDEESVKILIELLAEKNLFFIDSWTTGQTLGVGTARRMGVPTARNRIFLDNEDDPEYIRSRMELLKTIALKEDGIIAICHATRKHTAAVLREYIPILEEAGIEIVPAQELLK